MVDVDVKLRRRHNEHIRDLLFEAQALGDDLAEQGRVGELRRGGGGGRGGAELGADRGGLRGPGEGGGQKKINKNKNK